MQQLARVQVGDAASDGGRRVRGQLVVLEAGGLA